MFSINEQLEINIMIQQIGIDYSYGTNPKQTIRCFGLNQNIVSPWILVFLNSGYLENFQSANISETSVLLHHLAENGFKILTATVTYPGQPGIVGGGRFLNTDHPNYAIQDRVETDAIKAWNRIAEIATDLGLDPEMGGVFGRSGGSHPALWLCYKLWPEVVVRPKFCITLGSHTNWQSFAQNTTALPARHFYHMSDTNNIGNITPSKLIFTNSQDQINSSFFHYAQGTRIPSLWICNETNMEVNSLYPAPLDALNEGHSPYFSMLGYDKCKSLDPGGLHSLLLPQITYDIAVSYSLNPILFTSDLDQAVKTLQFIRSILPE